jgi:DNA polymerase elongation subunit (family B)
MNSQEISPQKDVLGAFPILLRDLTRRRLEAKARVRTATGEERARWDALQGSFKILINSFYGYLGFGIGHFNDFDAAEKVTLEGQRIIKQVVELLESSGATPIEVDTDGVYFSPPVEFRTGEDEETTYIENIGAQLGEGIRLAHDGRYAQMLSLKMKTYALIDYEGNLTLKGSALRSRRMEKCFQEFIRFAARGFMLEQRDAVRDAYFELAERIQKKQLDPSEIGQWAMLRRNTAEKNARLSRLLRSTQGQWKFGERVVIYERDDGELGLMQNYANDENTPILLRRLKETAQRFEDAFDSIAEFDAFFPTIQMTTNLEAARDTQPVQQLGLF